jgi:hypothetical protein
MSEICQGRDSGFQHMAMDQDKIGWQRFMESMVTKDLREIQTTYSAIEGSNVSPKQWTIGVIIKLLETTHAQWLFRCIQVHDRAQDTQATLRKEELQKKIEAQQDLGYDRLLKEDQYLAEVNLDDLESFSGKRQEYWMVAIRAVREACLLRGGSQPQECRNRLSQDWHIIT